MNHQATLPGPSRDVVTSCALVERRTAGRGGDPLLNLAALRGAPTTWIGPPAGGSPPSTAIGQPAQSCL